MKANLNQAASDIKLKKNVLDENRSLLGTKLIEVNIKEKSLMTQLQDLKTYIVTKLDGRFRELFTELSKTVREKRKAIEGRKTVLDRLYLQVIIFVRASAESANRHILCSVSGRLRPGLCGLCRSEQR